MKLIIFIHTCKLYEENRAKLLENTWARDNKDIVFITDNIDCKLNNYFYIGPYMYGNTYHPENVKKMFKLFLEKYNDYDYFMMIDDDSYLYVDKLKHFLSFFNKNDPYMIGNFLNCPRLSSLKNINGENYDYWIGEGPGIVFTKSCIIEFIKLYNTHNINYENHDMWLHTLYIKSNSFIKRVHCPGFHQYNGNELYKTIPLDSNNLISIHLNHDMNLLYKYDNNIFNYFNLYNNKINSYYANIKNIIFESIKSYDIEGNYTTTYNIINPIDYKYILYKQANLLWCSSLISNNANICEIGFNAGHSSILILEGQNNNTFNYTIFDIGEHKYMRPCFDYIKENYKNANMELIEGNSIETIPKWIETNKNKINSYSLIHIDGGHSLECIDNDMKNADLLIMKEGIIIIDDTNIDYINNYIDYYIKNKNYEEIILLQSNINYTIPHRIIKKK